MESDPGLDHATPRHAWDALGTDTALMLDGAELWWIELPFRVPVGTSVGVHRSRPLVLVQLHCRTHDGMVVDGWGECAALGDTTFDTEDVAGAWATLERLLLPALLARCRAEGRLPAVGAIAALGGVAPGRPLAAAAVEMAVADAHLRAAGRSFADLLGVGTRAVRPGAVVGTAPSTDELVATVASRAVEGYVRVKVKIAPGSELDTVSTITDWAATAHPPVPRFQVDANGAYGPADIDRLATLDRFGLVCIEQPFARDDLPSHRRLAARMATPICLDEGVDSPDRIRRAVGTGACSVVCVKPARLGGIGQALEAIGWCSAHGIPWWIGGMFESGFARAVPTALAGLRGPSLPGDLAPAGSYLAADIVPPVPGTLDPASRRLEVPVSRVPGVGPAPDPTVLGAHLVRHAVPA